MLNRIYKEIKKLGNSNTAQQRRQDFLIEMRRQFDAYTERIELQRQAAQKTFNSDVTFPIREDK